MDLNYQRNFNFDFITYSSKSSNSDFEDGKNRVAFHKLSYELYIVVLEFNNSSKRNLFRLTRNIYKSKYKRTDQNYRGFSFRNGSTLAINLDQKKWANENILTRSLTSTFLAAYRLTVEDEFKKALVTFCKLTCH